MALTFRQLEIFLAVVVAGSISRATRITGLSQPTISQQLASFEEDLGAQLIYRRRSGTAELTPVGVYWQQVAEDLLRRRDEALAKHKTSFRGDQLVMRFGTTPSLRGGFVEAAARIALDQGKFSRFEFVWALDSDEIVQKLDMHLINCGIVSETSVSAHRNSLMTTPLFSDPILFCVPRGVRPEDVRRALAGCPGKPPLDPVLSRWVAVELAVALQSRSQDWYRSHLPTAQPFFGAMTYEAAVDMVAAGLATCHCPGSLLPNLAEQVRSRVTFYQLGEFFREAVLVMPKHLLSMRAFADFAAALIEHTRTTYAEDRLLKGVLPLPPADPATGGTLSVARARPTPAGQAESDASKVGT